MKKMILILFIFYIIIIIVSGCVEETQTLKIYDKGLENIIPKSSDLGEGWIKNGKTKHIKEPFIFDNEYDPLYKKRILEFYQDNFTMSGNKILNIQIILARLESPDIALETVDEAISLLSINFEEIRNVKIGDHSYFGKNEINIQGISISVYIILFKVADIYIAIVGTLYEEQVIFSIAETIAEEIYSNLTVLSN